MHKFVAEDEAVDLILQSTQLFRGALDLYRDRLDKQWSLTDCVSFRIMEQQHIGEALTHDRHFEQFGFRALLR